MVQKDTLKYHPGRAERVPSHQRPRHCHHECMPESVALQPFNQQSQDDIKEVSADKGIASQK